MHAILNVFPGSQFVKQLPLEIVANGLLVITTVCSSILDSVTSKANQFKKHSWIFEVVVLTNRVIVITNINELFIPISYSFPFRMEVCELSQEVTVCPDCWIDLYSLRIIIQSSVDKYLLVTNQLEEA